MRNRNKYKLRNVSIVERQLTMMLGTHSMVRALTKPHGMACLISKERASVFIFSKVTKIIAPRRDHSFKVGRSVSKVTTDGWGRTEQKMFKISLDFTANKITSMKIKMYQ